jgi:hypothetical protein
MGAGRKAARSMKKYLGIRNGKTESTTLFGIPLSEKNFARIRAA